MRTNMSILIVCLCIASACNKKQEVLPASSNTTLSHSDYTVTGDFKKGNNNSPSVTTETMEVQKWNGLVGEAGDCFPPADGCAVVSPEVAQKDPLPSDVNTFINAVNNGTINDLYRSGEAQRICPLPIKQFKDIISNVTTIKNFQNDPEFNLKHFHIVYMDAKNPFDRPNYSN